MRSLCKVWLFLCCFILTMAVPTRVQAQRIRVPFVDVDRYRGQVRVRTPFVRVYRGADGVSVSTPFYRVNVPRSYPVIHPGPIPSPFQPQPAGTFVIQVQVPEGTPVRLPADVTSAMHNPAETRRGSEETAAQKTATRSREKWQASRDARTAQSASNPASAATEGSPIDDSEYSDAVIIKQRGTKTNVQKEPSAEVFAPPTLDSSESTAGSPGPVLRTPGATSDAPPYEAGPKPQAANGQRETANSTNTAAKRGHGKDVVAAKPVNNARGPVHQLIVPAARQSSRPQIRLSVVPLPHVARSAMSSVPGQQRPTANFVQGQRGNYYLTPIAHTELRERFEPSAGTHILALIHPVTRQAFGVELRLPAGTPQIKIKSDEVEFDYGADEIELEFNSDGSVSIDYD